jgi:hypothetical protein
MNARIEMLSKQILVSVGTEEAKIDAALYEELIASVAIRDLAYWGVRPTPAHVFANSSFKSCVNEMGIEFTIDDIEGSMIGTDLSISGDRFKSDSSDYQELRKRLNEILRKSNMTPESYLRKRLNVEEQHEG